MADLQLLKTTLEKICRIRSWSPSEADLTKISKRLIASSPSTLDEILDIVRDFIPSARYDLAESVDNSDLRTLIALANEAAKR